MLAAGRRSPRTLLLVGALLRLSPVLPGDAWVFSPATIRKRTFVAQHHQVTAKQGRTIAGPIFGVGPTLRGRSQPWHESGR